MLMLHVMLIDLLVKHRQKNNTPATRNYWAWTASKT